MTIAKRDGSRRILHNPDSLLRAYQFRILNGIFNQLDIPEYIHAFEKMKSIPAMAALHTGKRLVVSIDLKDFFHSIKQVRVQDALLGLGIGAPVARSLSELCTYKAFVPQGALTSPKLANIITATSFGPPVKEYCDSKGFTLSIYADDITVSTNEEGVNAKEIVREIIDIVRNTGFRINTKKTKIMFKSNRQYVCGVVVNQKTNLLKKERYRLRAIVHNIVTNGLEVEASKGSKTPEQFLHHIIGKINWFKQLNPELGDKLFTKLSTYIKENPVVHTTELVPELIVEASSEPTEDLPF